MKKGDTRNFGGNISVDGESDLVYTAKVTAANLHDVTVAANLLDEEERLVYGSSSYLGADKQPESPNKNHCRKCHLMV